MSLDLGSAAISGARSCKLSKGWRKDSHIVCGYHVGNMTATASL
jgi:hypothetical protein